MLEASDGRAASPPHSSRPGLWTAQDGRLPRPTLPPRQFPFLPPRLCGRDTELKALNQMLHSRDKARPLVAVISGPPGIGTTTLALRWLRCTGPFAHGQLYACFGGATAEPVQEVLERWLRALGVPGEWIPPGGPERSALWRSVSAGRALAILADDVPSAAAVGALAPGPGPAVMAVTARSPLHAAAADGARFLRLKPLSRNASASLLKQIAGPGQAAGGGDTFRQLAELCGGIPLAVRIAAGLLVICPQRKAAGIAAELAARCGHLHAAPGSEAVIGELLEMSYSALTPSAARTYRLLSFLPEPEFGSRLAAAVLATPRGSATLALGELRRARLVEQAGSGQYHIHDAVRAHARRLADETEPQHARQAAIERITGWYLHQASQVRQLLRSRTRRLRRDAPDWRHSGPDIKTDGQALGWLEPERPGQRAAVVLAAGQDNHAAAWQLADALCPLWAHRGHYGEQLRTARIGLDSARACADPAAQARMLDHIGHALHHLGQPGEAARAFARARALWQKLGNQRRQALSARGIGRAAAARGEHQAAIAVYWLALGTWQRDGDARQAALTKIDLGAVLSAAGQDGEAARMLREAIRVLGPDPYNLARARAALGRALWSQPTIATCLLENALTAMTGLGDLPAQAEILESLAEASLRAGTPERARACYEQALRILPARHPRARVLHAAVTGLQDGKDPQ
jgi:tetratricopeptide (TPR) repeat protein